MLRLPRSTAWRLLSGCTHAGRTHVGPPAARRPGAGSRRGLTWLAAAAAVPAALVLLALERDELAALLRRLTAGQGLAANALPGAPAPYAGRPARNEPD